MQITFIIPCYNAKNIIIKNYEKLLKFIKREKIKGKIIYINDGSQDRTIEELRKIKSKDVKIFDNKHNLGKSKSIVKVLKTVKTKNIVLIDCDLPYFKYLKTVIKNLNRYDLVSINRKLKSSMNLDKNKNLYKITRNLISNFLGFLVEKKLKLNVNGDTQAGLKAFKIVSRFKKIHFISKYYFLDIELINFYRQNNFKIKLIPVKFNISDKSSIKFFSFKNFKIIFEFFKVLNRIKS
tara:strand:- start:338 stop:1048 length:711 start_codon:yes stop_codon:yes gene_type:complete